MPKRARYNAWLLGWSGTTVADTAYGPWNLSIAASSVGFSRTLPTDAPVLRANGDWTISAWVRPQAIPQAHPLMAGFSDAGGAAHYFSSITTISPSGGATTTQPCPPLRCVRSTGNSCTKRASRARLEPYVKRQQQGNGAVHDVMQAMQERFGTPTKLVDFERKAQMMDDVSYRAIFEGLNVNQWTRDSGRLLWMSLPAWPSTTWQVYSHDYDTQRILPAYYSDNDLNLPSGTSREVELSVEDGTDLQAARVKWRGWNIVPGETPVSGKQNPTEAGSFVGCNSFVTNQPLVHGCHRPSTHGRG